MLYFHGSSLENGSSVYPTNAVLFLIVFILQLTGRDKLLITLRPARVTYETLRVSEPEI